MAKTDKTTGLCEESIQNIEPKALIIPQNIPRLPSITTIRMPDVESQTQIISFDLEGIALSSGSACSSGKIEVPTIKGMGHHSDDFIRISLGLNTTKEDIDAFIRIWTHIYNKSSLKKYG